MTTIEIINDVSCVKIPILGYQNEITYRYMSQSDYNKVLERRKWPKFGDAEGNDSVKELKPEKWIIPNKEVVDVSTEVIKPNLIKCRTCGGPHLTYKCSIKSTETKPVTGIYKQKVNDNFFTVKVSNLSEDDDVTKDELLEFFSKFGTVKDGYRGITMNRDKRHWNKDSGVNYDTLPFLGVAYVKYQDKDEMDIIVNKINQHGRHRKYNMVKCEVVPSFNK